MQEKKKPRLAMSFIFTIFMCCYFPLQAQNSTFIKEQVEHLNKVIAENSTGPNDPKAAFSVDDANSIITLTFKRNKSLAGQNRESLQMVATMLPNALIQQVYLKTAGIINGQIIGVRFIEALQNDNYTMKVIIKGTDQQFEFDIPVRLLTL